MTATPHKAVDPARQGEVDKLDGEIIASLQRYSSLTGAPLGGDVVEWFARANAARIEQAR